MIAINLIAINSIAINLIAILYITINCNHWNQLQSLKSEAIIEINSNHWNQKQLLKSIAIIEIICNHWNQLQSLKSIAIIEINWFYLTFLWNLHYVNQCIYALMLTLDTRLVLILLFTEEALKNLKKNNPNPIRTINQI